MVDGRISRAPDIKKIDEEMNMEFTKIAEGENLENILKLWKDACATEELYSLQRGEKNNNFLQVYETQFKEPIW